MKEVDLEKLDDTLMALSLVKMAAYELEMFLYLQGKSGVWEVCLLLCGLSNAGTLQVFWSSDLVKAASAVKEADQLLETCFRVKGGYASCWSKML